MSVAVGFVALAVTAALYAMVMQWQLGHDPRITPAPSADAAHSTAEAVCARRVAQRESAAMRSTEIA